jgi:site-specific DNA recombinase
MTTQPRASLYVRLSKEAGETNLSLPGMMADLRDLAEKLGYAVHAEHADHGISGAVRDRPEFLAWLDEARTGTVDALLTYHADRLTREGVNAAAMVLDVLEGKDPTTGKVVRTPVRLVSHDGLDSERDAESFRWRFVIAAEVARAERERIKARNSRTQARLREAGRYRGGTVPFGTRVTERDGGKYLTTDEAEAAILREVASNLLGGASFRSEVRRLNAAGIRTRRGVEWDRSSLRNTLTSTATREHVLDRPTFRALSERMSTGPGTAPRGGRPVAALLSGGLARCGGCGGPMTTRRSRTLPWRYVCRAQAEGTTCPAPVSIDGEALDAHVAQEYLATYGDHKELRTRVLVPEDADLEAAEQDAEDAERRLMAEMTAEAFEEAQAARARRDALRARPTGRRMVTFEETGKTYADVWHAAEGDTAARAALLRQYVVSVGVAPATTQHRTGVRGGSVDLSRVVIAWAEDVEPPSA